MAELPAPTISPDEATDTARSVLNGRAYVEANRPPSLRERAFDWLGERIADLFNALSSGGGRGLVAWVIIALFVGLIVWLLVRVFRETGPLRTVTVDTSPSIAIVTTHTADEWRRMAGDHEANGEWRLGLRCRHRSLAASLIDRDLADAHPGLTAAALSREAGEHRPDIAEPLAEATALFEQVWYGRRPAGPDTSASFQSQADIVLARCDAGAPVEVGA